MGAALWLLFPLAKLTDHKNIKEKILTRASLHWCWYPGTGVPISYGWNINISMLSMELRVSEFIWLSSAPIWNMQFGDVIWIYTDITYAKIWTNKAKQMEVLIKSVY